MDSLQAEPPGKLKNTGVGSLSPPVDLPDSGIKPGSPALQEDSLLTKLSGKPESSTHLASQICWSFYSIPLFLNFGLDLSDPEKYVLKSSIIIAYLLHCVNSFCFIYLTTILIGEHGLWLLPLFYKFAFYHYIISILLVPILKARIGFFRFIFI